MLMGFPPKIFNEEVDTLVQDFWEVISKREKEMESHYGSHEPYPIYTNDTIICALEIVKTRIIASEVLIVKNDSER